MSPDSGALREPPAPTQAWLPDTFIERVYQEALREAIGDGVVMLSAFEASAIRNRVSRGAPSAPALP